MSWWQVIVLSVVQGLTEFLPVSSSGHLAIVSRVFFADDAGASFTAVTQLGTELAVLVYFARDIVRIVKAWFNGLFVAAHRNADYRLGWFVIIGSIPIGVFGLLFKDEIRTGARNLWLIATAMIVFSAVIAAAEYFGNQKRHVDELTWRDSVTVGLAQCLALVPGTSRSGATIIGGMLLGLSRRAATDFSFYLAIPTLIGAGAYSLYKERALLSMADLPLFGVGLLFSFVSAWLCVRWLLRYISSHTFVPFAWYRIAFGLVVLATAYSGWVTWAD